MTVCMQIPANSVRRRLGARGFTLIELMLVVALIGIVSMLAGPKLNGMYHRSVLNGTARKLFSALMTAQAQATATGARHCLVIDRTARNWVVRQDSDSNGTCDSTDKLVERYPSSTSENDAGQSIPPYVAFGPAAGVAASRAIDLRHGPASSADVQFGRCLHRADAMGPTAAGDGPQLSFGSRRRRRPA